MSTCKCVIQFVKGYGRQEYREALKSKSGKIFLSETEKKLMVDGNERFMFHGALVACSLRTNEESVVCQNKLCAVCRIVTSGFPVNDASVTFYDNCRRSHENINRESVADNRLCARTAIIICRVIAGRVANYHELAFMDEVGGFDSVVSSTGYQSNGSEQLVALNRRAVLPCFVVIYGVNSS
ncbi:hypothetical protein L6164_033640 [Bauhinia variegata]|uniref:Uncharacterized protein n=1 Tax=Bauhinia variegata TaxID=167791 RepID=A0ACB9KSQ5_BAUVA|nr:hypothetical protein L6164_033640 [Bauhinia variegata]